MPDLLTRDDMTAVGEAVADAIRTRTRGGVGADGARLARRADGTASTLTDTGRMLDSLRVTATDGGVTVAPTVAYAAHADAARPFVGLTPSQQHDTADRVLEGRLAAREAELNRNWKARR